MCIRLSSLTTAIMISSLSWLGCSFAQASVQEQSLFARLGQFAQECKVSRHKGCRTELSFAFAVVWSQPKNDPPLPISPADRSRLEKYVDGFDRKPKENKHNERLAEAALDKAKDIALRNAGKLAPLAGGLLNVANILLGEDANDNAHVTEFSLIDLEHMSDKQLEQQVDKVSTVLEFMVSQEGNVTSSDRDSLLNVIAAFSDYRDAARKEQSHRLTARIGKGVPGLQDPTPKSIGKLQEGYLSDRPSSGGRSGNPAPHEPYAGGQPVDHDSPSADNHGAPITGINPTGRVEHPTPPENPGGNQPPSEPTAGPSIGPD